MSGCLCTVYTVTVYSVHSKVYVQYKESSNIVCVLNTVHTAYCIQKASTLHVYSTVFEFDSTHAINFDHTQGHGNFIGFSYRCAMSDTVVRWGVDRRKLETEKL